MQDMKDNIIKIIVAISLILLVIGVYYYKGKRNDQLTKNAVYTIGKVSKVVKSGGSTRRSSTTKKIIYKYYHKGEWIKDEGPLEETSGEVRKRETNYWSVLCRKI